jgi:hypothetical protein
MEEYRAYFVGHDGHFSGFEPIVRAHDDAAIDKAKRLVNRHGIEIWNGARLVGRLEPMRASKPSRFPWLTRPLHSELDVVGLQMPAKTKV